MSVARQEVFQKDPIQEMSNGPGLAGSRKDLFLWQKQEPWPFLTSLKERSVCGLTG